MDAHGVGNIHLHAPCTVRATPWSHATLRPVALRVPPALQMATARAEHTARRNASHTAQPSVSARQASQAAPLGHHKV